MASCVLINADDYGLTDRVCDAINELALCGAISNTTLMLCADGAPERIGRKQVPSVAEISGVHLQLTSGTPISPIGDIPSLVDAAGRFHDPRKTPVNPIEVEIEWRAQVELAKELLGKTPTHIDSHHGMHRLPDLFPVYLKIAREYSIPFRGANNELREVIISKNLNGTSSIVRDWTGSCTGVEGLLNSVQRTYKEFHSPRVIEIVTHPGFSDDTLRGISSLNDKRNCDYEGLLKARETLELERIGCKMSSFHEVNKFA